MLVLGVDLEEVVQRRQRANLRKRVKSKEKKLMLIHAGSLSLYSTIPATCVQFMHPEIDDLAVQNYLCFVYT
jgi:hypothetical protein